MNMENQTKHVSRSGTNIPKDVKEYVLKKMKEGSKSVAEVATECGIGKTAIYKWLKEETTSGSPDPQVFKLQKENQLLKQLVAELSLKIRESEKRGW
jgi:transposase-like protein